MEMIGNGCFYGSGIKEMTLPRTLKGVGKDVFGRCYNLRAIRLEGDREADLAGVGVSCSVRIILPSVTFPGGASLEDLRQTKSVVIPDGVERVGAYWFRRSEVESVEIPASVREIGEEAFYGCSGLKQVVFAAGSRLESIGVRCFCSTGLERVVIPKEVGEIMGGAFYECRDLKEVAFEEASKLGRIGNRCFSETGIERISVPGSVETIWEKAF